MEVTSFSQTPTHPCGSLLILLVLELGGIWVAALDVCDSSLSFNFKRFWNLVTLRMHKTSSSSPGMFLAKFRGECCLA
jgi:hypothetical protein